MDPYWEISGEEPSLIGLRAASLLFSIADSGFVEIECSRKADFASGQTAMLLNACSSIWFALDAAPEASQAAVASRIGADAQLYLLRALTSVSLQDLSEAYEVICRLLLQLDASGALQVEALAGERDACEVIEALAQQELAQQQMSEATAPEPKQVLHASVFIEHRAAADRLPWSSLAAGRRW